MMLVFCPFNSPGITSSRPAHLFVEKLFPFSADSGRSSCQFLAKERALNAGKLPTEGLSRNSVVKQLTVPT